MIKTKIKKLIRKFKSRYTFDPGREVDELNKSWGWYLKDLKHDDNIPWIWSAANYNPPYYRLIIHNNDLQTMAINNLSSGLIGYGSNTYVDGKAISIQFSTSLPTNTRSINDYEWDGDKIERNLTRTYSKSFNTYQELLDEAVRLYDLGYNLGNKRRDPR